MTENHAPSGQPLLVGAVKRPITPTVKGRNVFIAGGEHRREATDIHDELWARAIAVRCNGVTMILIALDLLGFTRENVTHVRARAIQAGLPAENLIIACTRNHAGPDTSGRYSKGWLGSGFNLRYVQFLHRELVEVSRLAVASLQPAQTYMARRQVTGLFLPTEARELAVIQFRTPEQRTIATVVNFPLVPRVVGEENTLIGADFPNWLYSDLEGRQARDEVTLYICAEGNEHPLPPFRERTWAEAERIGRALAADVRGALSGIVPTPIERLQVWHKAMALPPRDPITKWLRKARGRPGNGAAHAERSDIGLIELGPARMAAVPGLVAPQIGSQMRKMLDAPYRFVLGVSNDDLGYIPPQDDPNHSQIGTIILDELDRLLLDAEAVRG